METKQTQAWSLIIEEIKRIVAEKGRGGVTYVGKLLGVTRGTVSRWLSKDLQGKQVPYDKTVAIMQKLGLDPSEFFDLGDKDSEYTKVPWLDAVASMGGGSVETSRSVNAHMAFRTDWLRSLGRLSGMVVVNASGDSMSPTIPDRAVVLINETDKTPENNAIFFVCYGNGDNSQIYLKRLRVKNGKVTHLISDFDGHEEELQSEEYFEIIGRALWYGRAL